MNRLKLLDWAIKLGFVKTDDPEGLREYLLERERGTTERRYNSELNTIDHYLNGHLDIRTYIDDDGWCRRLTTYDEAGNIVDQHINKHPWHVEFGESS